MIKLPSFFTKILLLAFVFFMSLIVLLPSQAHADYLFGGPTISSVNLYTEDGSFNEVTINLGSSRYLFSSFPIPTDNGIKWVNSNTTWSLSTLPLSNDNKGTFLSYVSSRTIPSPGHSGWYDLETTFTLQPVGDQQIKEGIQQIRLTASKNSDCQEEVTDGSDKLAYTMTILIVDNSPKKSSAPSPTPPSN